MSNPWKKVAAPADVKSLPDIMSEEYYKNIWTEVEAELEQPQLLQCELDKEHKDEIKATKNELNRDVQLISYNYSNMDSLAIASNNESDSEDDNVQTASDDWEYFGTNEKEITCLSKQNSASKDKRMAIKHDILSSKKNSSSILDERSRRIVCKLIKDDLIKGINGVISMGKESIILHAYAVKGYYKYFPNECAIKVFKTTRKTHMRHNKFIKDDSGFKTPLKLAYLKAKKEYLASRNLYFLHNPYVCYQIEHVLVMQFIGNDEKQAPNLKDAILTHEEWQSAYKQVADAIKKLYHTGALIHGRLIENNIMWWKKECWIINFSQSVHRDHPKGYKYLLHDCRNICNFFKKKGVQEMEHSKEELFEWITGLEVAHFIKN